MMNTIRKSCAEGVRHHLNILIATEQITEEQSKIVRRKLEDFMYDKQ